MRGNSIMPLALINRQAEGAQGAASGAKERSSRCTYRLRPAGACSWLGRRTATGGPPNSTTPPSRSSPRC